MNIIHGDCLEELKKLEDCSVDAVVTDPPYGLSNTKPQQVADVLAAWVTGQTEAVPAKRGGFMGKDWDSFVPPPAVWEECLRVLKPGGHMAVFAGARTQDLMGLSIRLAGFEIRDTLGWIYGSGFPKSHDISKAIDRQRNDNNDWKTVGSFLKGHRVSAGYATRNSFADKILNGHSNLASASANLSNWENGLSFPTWERWEQLKGLLNLPDDMDAEVWRLNGRKGAPGEAWEKREVTQHATRGLVQGDAISFDQRSSKERERRDIPATSEAAKWDGWGTALKPAIEPIILARKPLDGTVAANVLAHGVGGLNIDACRVPSDDVTGLAGAGAGGGTWNSENMGLGKDGDARPVQGRFPANVLLDEHAATEMDRQSGVLKSGAVKAHHKRSTTGGNGLTHGDMRGVTGPLSEANEGGASRFFPVFKSEEETPETKGRFPANVLLDEHAAAEMDKQSGVLKTGSHMTHHVFNGSENASMSGRNYTRSPRVNSPANEGGASRFFPVFKYQAKAPKKERPVIYLNECECNEWQSPEKATTESTSTGGRSWNTSTSGSGSTGQYQTDTTSITSTMTSSTIESKTYDASPELSTSASIQAANCETVSGGNRAECADHSSPSVMGTGTSVKKAGRSTDGAAPVTSQKWFTTSECESCGAPRRKVTHCTVKPLALMEWLVELITPPNGVVLDPFAGTGTTLQAATNKGFQPIGIEQDADYIQLIEKRLSSTNGTDAQEGELCLL